MQLCNPQQQTAYPFAFVFKGSKYFKAYHEEGCEGEGICLRQCWSFDFHGFSRSRLGGRYIFQKQIMKDYV